jgi:hypothetical protein
MKKIITLASVAMLNVYAFAQPVVNSNDVAPNFNADFYFLEMPAGFSAGSAGSNQTWNFSTIGSGTFLGTDTAIPVAGSPYASQFPQANYLYAMNSAFSNADMYFYHTLTPAKFEIYSLGYGGDVGENYQQNPRTYVVFPYTYNTVFTDDFKENSSPTTSTVTATYDAYGTLIMPFGTFNNVVRQKQVIDGVTNYSWFNVSPFYPILQTAFEDGILGYIVNNTALGIGDHTQMQSLVTFPNPAASVLNIKIPDGFNGPASLTISDLSGKTLIKSTFDAANQAVNVEQLSQGVYIIKLSGETGEYVGKIVKG